MFDNLDDFKKKAIDNKANLKFKNITIPIGDGEQDFRITGIGEKAIKIELSLWNLSKISNKSKDS